VALVFSNLRRNYKRQLECTYVCMYVYMYATASGEWVYVDPIVLVHNLTEWSRRYWWLTVNGLDKAKYRVVAVKCTLRSKASLCPFINQLVWNEHAHFANEWLALQWTNSGKISTTERFFFVEFSLACLVEVLFSMYVCTKNGELEEKGGKGVMPWRAWFNRYFRLS
jgi:hypothetical protein